MMDEQQTTVSEPSYKRLYVSPAHHARLTAIVEASRPEVTLIAMVEWLIDCEMERRGIDPETLEPRADAEAGAQE